MLASDIMGESLLLCVMLVKFGNSEGVAAHSFEYLQPSLLDAAAWTAKSLMTRVTLLTKCAQRRSRKGAGDK